MDELSVDVGNGRALGYREYGAPDGRPVVNCHGGLLCGLDVASFGDADELVPPKWGDELARRIPNARLEVRAGEGHFLGYLHQADILREFAN